MNTKKFFLIGGYVRDELISKYHPELNIIPNDKDYVAIGYTEEEMDKLYGRKHGKQFPVWIDNNGNEIALARTERKIGNSHTDFEFIFSAETTLREDCERRNHTINAIAKDIETGEYIDYFNGIEDIKNKIIRCINPETFIQDPLRVLILARQYAQLKDFEVEPLTKRLCWKMAQEGMLKNLSAERVWKELEKALQPGYASHKFFELLLEINALEDWFPEIQKLFETPEIKEYHPLENSGKHTMACLKKYEELMSE